MGKIRVPKPIYDDKFVMNFKVKNKEINYTISKWNDEGTKLSSLVSEKLLDQEPKTVLKTFQQSFSFVIR